VVFNTITTLIVVPDHGPLSAPHGHGRVRIIFHVAQAPGFNLLKVTRALPEAVITSRCVFRDRDGLW